MGVLLITDFSYGAMLPFSVPGLKSVYSYLNGAGKIGLSLVSSQVSLLVLSMQR